MLLSLLLQNPAAFVITAAALLIALTWHEAAHALVAKRLGDDTAEMMGRLTLNPLAHLDPLGTAAIFFAGIGWGKPVPVNPANFASPRLDNLKVALAGPLSNLILAAFFALAQAVFRPDSQSLAAEFSQIVIFFNLLLAFFNLIPIPPLDGSKIAHLFMSDETYYRFEQIGFILLIGLIGLSWLGFPLLSFLIYTPANFFYNLLTGLPLPSIF